MPPATTFSLSPSHTPTALYQVTEEAQTFPQPLPFRVDKELAKISQVGVGFVSGSGKQAGIPSIQQCQGRVLQQF